jgi:hypothetical protein
VPAGGGSSQRAWAAAGPELRIEGQLLGPLELQASVAPVLHMTADRFLFLPDVTIAQVPLLGLWASAGLLVHFL